MIHSTILHGGFLRGNNLDEQVAQLHEGEIAVACDGAAHDFLEAKCLVELHCPLHVGSRHTYVLHASREGVHIHPLLGKVLGVECHLVALILTSLLIGLGSVCASHCCQDCCCHNQ